jgi:septal ring factor EnvC (AmiA/AmiB activator)
MIGALAAMATPAIAADTPDPTKLKALERDLEQSQAERDRLQSQAVEAARALETIRADIIATAKEIQDQEHSLTVLDNRVGELETEAARLTKTLGRRDAQMVQVLMAIERLALRPTDALTLNPLSPADAVRSAILLRAALPHIKQSSASLQEELKDLYRVRTEIVARKEQAAAGAAALAQKHNRLDALVREKADKHETLLARGEDASQRVMKIAREAQDLRALFAKLAEEKARREEQERKIAAQRAEHERVQREAQREKEQKEKARQLALKPDSSPAPGSSPSSGRIILKAPPGVEPLPSPQAEAKMAALPPAPQKLPGGNEEAVTRSFAKARGTLPFPVMGRLSSKYGEARQVAGEAGLMAKGITITSRPGAQVVAPFDGIIAFSGPFRGYGQLLIIEHSEGYHTLLAGMGHIDARVGQRVLAGEPVGIMENDGAPALYVELRRDGQPINPLPWLADRAGKNSG